MKPGTSLLDSLGDRAVDVWVVPLEDVDDATATLSPAERLRAGRRSGIERRQFVARHGAARAIAADYLGVAPTALELEAPYGEKPRVAGSVLELSLAHSAELALVAVATVPVGVDVERIDELPEGELADLAEFSLSSRELRELDRLPETARRNAFLRVWTRKEAYLKSVGQGISDRSLAEIEVSAADQPARLIAAGGDAIGSVMMFDLEPAPGYVGALATAGAAAVSVHRWPSAAAAIVRKSDTVV